MLFVPPAQPLSPAFSGALPERPMLPQMPGNLSPLSSLSNDTFVKTQPRIQQAQPRLNFGSNRHDDPHVQIGDYDFFKLENIDRQDLGGAAKDKAQQVADWVENYIAIHHPEQYIDPAEKRGKQGAALCPYVPKALSNHTMWMAIDDSTELSVEDVIERTKEIKDNYAKLHIGRNDPLTSALIIFPNVPPEEFGPRLRQAHRAFYPDFIREGLAPASFYPTHERSGARNSDMKVFRSPVPTLVLRYALPTDIAFYTDPGAKRSPEEQRLLLEAFIDRFAETNPRATDEARRLLAENS